jgi:hypothetical protein
MIFTAPIGLLALVAIPAIVAIHLFRRKFPVRPVAGLFLWQGLRQVPEGGGKIARLPITRSLILECLAALALALVVAGARLSPAAATEHLVVLLDDSASMGARNDAGESARDRAVRRVLTEVDRLGGGGRVTLVLSGERPSVLAGPAALEVEARSALDKWTPEAPDHALSLGLRLARELAGRTGKLMVLSDVSATVRGEPGFENGLWVSVGQPIANLGIIGAQRTLSPNQGRGIVSLTLANHSDAAVRRRVSVTAAAKQVLAQDVDIPPGTSSLSLPLPPGLPLVDVALSDDGLARDNAVTLAEPRPQVVGIENRLPEGRGRDALVRAMAAVSGVRQADSGHLVFGEAATLDQRSSPGVWRVGFGRPPAAWVAPGAAADFVGPFVIEKRHPLLSGMTLGGVVWTGALPLVKGATRPLVSAGEQVLVGISGSSPSLLIEPAIFVNLDLQTTNLIRAPDWPILISNLVELRRRSLPGPERWNYRVGEWVRLKLAQDPKGTLRARCGAVERTLPSGRQLEFPAPAPGGRLQILDGEQVLFELGVNFLDDRESNLRRASSGESGALGDVAGMHAERGPESDPLFWILLAIGGASIVANWCSRTRA